MKEKYEEIKHVMEKIQYNIHNWQICVDFKMVNFLLGQQSGYTKYPCFICLWDSRDTKNHYVKKKWLERREMIPGTLNIVHGPLVERDRILLPLLHIKLGLI